MSAIFVDSASFVNLRASPRSAAVPDKKNGAHRQARPAETTNTDINRARRSAF